MHSAAPRDADRLATRPRVGEVHGFIGLVDGIPAAAAALDHAAKALHRALHPR